MILSNNNDNKELSVSYIECVVLIRPVHHCGLEESACACDGTGCEFESWSHK